MLFILLDMWKGRVEFPELKKKVVELYELHKVNEILIEDKASGQSLVTGTAKEYKTADKTD